MSLIYLALIPVVAFFGSAAGVIWSLKAVTRRILENINKDPDLGKIEINVGLTKEPE